MQFCKQVLDEETALSNYIPLVLVFQLQLNTGVKPTSITTNKTSNQKKKNTNGRFSFSESSCYCFREESYLFKWQ